MTLMLASVTSLEEAEIVLAEGVDIIDLKDPAQGSLGALDVAVVKAVVGYVNGRCPISATIGDLPMQPELIANAVLGMAETGVDYIKIGLRPDRRIEHVLEKLTQPAKQIQIIAVLFADNFPDSKLVGKLYASGFKGIMLDTLDKSKGSLTGLMSIAELQSFVYAVQANGFVCGLAGSLRPEDVVRLCHLRPNYLGFRGALCDQGLRVARLNSLAVAQIRQTIAALPQ